MAAEPGQRSPTLPFGQGAEGKTEAIGKWRATEEWVEVLVNFRSQK
jgi:hypothetical protein